MPPHVSQSLKDFLGPGALTSVSLAVVSGVLGLGLPWLHRLRQVLAAARLDEREQADAILVLGRTLDRRGQATAVFRDRLRHAFDLYRAGLAPRLIVAGGLTGRSTVSEAAVGRDLLVELGVPAEHILLEDRSRHTLENLFNTREDMARLGWRRLLIVSDPLHLARVGANARGFRLDHRLSPAVACPPRRGSLHWWGRALREAFFLHWYHVGIAYHRAVGGRRVLSRVT